MRYLLQVLALLAVGAVLVGFAAPAEAKRCERLHRADGGTKSYIFSDGKGSARSLARVTWSREVERRHGAQFADWRIAKNKKIRCWDCFKKPNWSGCRYLRKTKGFVCRAQAQPCEKK